MQRIFCLLGYHSWQRLWNPNLAWRTGYYQCHGCRRMLRWYRATEPPPNAKEIA